MAEIDDGNIKHSGLNIELLEANTVRKKHILLREEGSIAKLIEITDISKSKPGKHGAAKFNFTGVDLTSGKNYSFTEGTKNQVTTCTFKRVPCIVLDMDERNNELHLFNEDDSTDFYVSMSKIPDDTKDKLSKFMAIPESKEIKCVLIDTPYYTNVVDIVKNIL